MPFWHTHVHPMPSLVQKQCHLVIGHTLSYTVWKIEANLANSSRVIGNFVHPCSCSCSDTHCQNVNLFHSIYFWYATHGLPTASSCTTPYIQLGFQQPDVRVLPIQVPAWDLDPNSQEQGWWKTWLSALHPGQRGLCCHGQMGTSRWNAQEWPHEVLRLNWEHIRWWDLPTSPCLWAGRHHKEVWWIHWWASRSNMPIHLQGTNWQWQWCCNRIWSSMQADLGNPRHQHQAVQTTSEGQPWQKGITSARDLQNILCCGIRSGCNVHGTCSTCHMPQLPDTWS